MATLTATQKKKLSDLRELTGKFVQYQRRNRLRELTAEKSQQDAIKKANYRNAGPASTMICKTCSFAEGGNHCSRFDFTFDDNFVCDDYKPNIPALRARGRELAGKDKMTLKQRVASRLKQAPTKTIAGQKRPSSDFLSVPDPTKPGTWGLPVKVNGKLSRRLMGAAAAALTVGFRGNKYEGPDKQQAINKLLALYKQIGATPPANLVGKGKETAQKSTFKVYKGKNGRSYWVAHSSTAYRDHDGEIVSTKSLENAVRANDASGNYGPLRFWHVKGADIGTCEFQAVHGRILVEAGTFNNERIAQKVAQNAQNLTMSIGFRHPATEPDNQKIYHNINIFERSLIPPQGKAANLYTSFQVKGDRKIMSITNEKREALRLLLGETADEILQSAEDTQKAADVQGVAYKETKDPTMSELLEAWNIVQEAQKEMDNEEAAVIDEVYPEPVAVVEAEKADDTNDRPVTQAMFNAAMSRLMAAISGTKSKEADELTAVTARMDELQTQIKQAQTELAELTSSQPRASNGYRATQSAPPVANSQIMTQTKEAEEKWEQAVKDMGPGAAQFAGVAEMFASSIVNPHNNPGQPWDNLT